MSGLLVRKEDLGKPRVVQLGADCHVQCVLPLSVVIKLAECALYLKSLVEGEGVRVTAAGVQNLLDDYELNKALDQLRHDGKIPS